MGPLTKVHRESHNELHSASHTRLTQHTPQSNRSKQAPRSYAAHASQNDTKGWPLTLSARGARQVAAFLVAHRGCHTKCWSLTLSVSARGSRKVQLFRVA